MNESILPDQKTLAKSLLTFLVQQNPDLERGLTVSSKLTESGIDSFSLIELVLFIERQFKVSMPLESLTPQIVESLTTLASAVTQRCSTENLA